ncbi:MAG: GAF domain-containing protein, partial [Bacteroidota bacterium]
MSAGLAIGLGLVIISLILVIPVLVVVAMRHLPKGTSSSETASPFIFPENVNQNEAVVIIQVGGRVEYINPLAREWFGLDATEPADLERLVRRARPAEELLNLFALPGQRRLSIGGRLVEATSYQVPGPYPLMFVLLRNAELAASLDEGGLQTPVLQIITNFGRNVSVSLNLEDTLHAVLLNVSQLVPADLVEIKIWEDANQTITTFTLETSGSSNLVKSPHSQFGELYKKALASRKPFLVTDTTAEYFSADELQGSLVRSYLVLPLVAEDRLVGFLEVGHLTQGALGQHDQELLQLVSPQAAYSIRNALLYTREQNRSVQLAGLADLAQAFGSEGNYADLIRRLIEIISPLFSVEVLGFLLYDEESRTLQGQIPFQGLPEHIVAIYRGSVDPGGPAETLIFQNQPVISRNAADDPAWKNLGMQNFAQAASLRESILMPMRSNGNFVGYLQLSNHRGSASPFSDSEISLSRDVADRATGIIENSFVMEKSRQQTLRSDALRRIAGLVVSNATLADILCSSVKEITGLFRCDLGAVYFLDEQLGELRLHRESAYGVPAETTDLVERLLINEAQFRYTVSGSQKPFISGRLSSDRRILPVYRPLISVLQVESAIVVPLVAHGRSLGELMFGSQRTEFFNSYDLEVISTVGMQLASAIEVTTQATQTDESLRRSVEQLTSIVRVTRELNSMLDLKPLLAVVRDEAVLMTRADCGAVLLFDDTDPSKLEAVSVSEGCSLPEALSRLDQKVIASGDALLVGDDSVDGYEPTHEGVRSAMIVPIMDKSRVAGLIQVHSTQAGSFDASSLEVVQTLASHTAVALENIQRNKEQLQRSELLRRRSETLTKLTEVSY